MTRRDWAVSAVIAALLLAVAVGSVIFAAITVVRDAQESPSPAVTVSVSVTKTPSPAPTVTVTKKPKPVPTVTVTREVVVTRSKPRTGVDAFLACVRAHESDTAGGYKAENPISTASGAYQFIDASWQAYSRMAGYPGWSHASYAPPSVQDAVARWVVVNKGHYPWKGTHCGYGT